MKNNKFRFVRVMQGSSVAYAVEKKKLFKWKEVYSSSRPDDCIAFIERCAKKVREVVKDNLYCQTVAFALENDTYTKLCDAAKDNDSLTTPNQMALKIVSEFLRDYDPRKTKEVMAEEYHKRLII